ncbi:MAG: oligosaccharide flippase family protein [Methanobacterium sp.]|jgi:O-antigen/teichoic acid export membrane protein
MAYGWNGHIHRNLLQNRCYKLSLIVGQRAVGLYSAAYQLSETTTIIPTMFITAIYPVMSRFYKDSKSSFTKTYAKSTKYLFFIGILVALIITLLADPIISLIFGIKFSGSVFALQIIIWSAALMYITMLQGNTYIQADKQIFSIKLLL